MTAVACFHQMRNMRLLQHVHNLLAHFLDARPGGQLPQKLDSYYHENQFSVSRAHCENTVPCHVVVVYVLH